MPLYSASIGRGSLPVPSRCCALFFPGQGMPRSVVGLPSSPRPPNNNRPASSAHHHNSLHVLSAGPSGTRNDYLRHRSIHSIPSESRRSTPLQGRYSAHRPATSERLRISSQWANRPDMSFATNPPYERRKTQPRVNTSLPHPSAVPGSYWNRAGEATSAAIAQWRAGIPPLGNLVDDRVEEDGHLLKVMRAYHLNKARTREELPDWLFDEKERGLLVPWRSRIPEKEVNRPGRLPREDKRDQFTPPNNDFYSPSGGSPARWKKILSRQWKPCPTPSPRESESLY